MHISSPPLPPPTPGFHNYLINSQLWRDRPALIPQPPLGLPGTAIDVRSQDALLQKRRETSWTVVRTVTMELNLLSSEASLLNVGWDSGFPVKISVGVLVQAKCFHPTVRNIQHSHPLVCRENGFLTDVTGAKTGRPTHSHTFASNMCSVCFFARLRLHLSLFFSGVRLMHSVWTGGR